MEVEAAGAYRRVQDAITEGRCVVLDGGVATELSHRHGQDHERLWGIEALSSSPEEVSGVHTCYLDAGVDVLTTNTWALPTLIEGDRVAHGQDPGPVHWMELARRGVRVAREAIAAHERAGECAVAFALNGDLDAVDGVETAALIARALGSDPPDIILLETLSVLRPELFDVIEVLQSTGIPVWLSFRRCAHGLCGVYGQHWGGPEGDAFGRAALRFAEMGVAALLVNCIPPDHVDGVVSMLRDFTDMPLGVYPNLGYYTSVGWRFESGVSGEQYAQMARGWRAEGAQIIGGCCGTRPEHIAAARDALHDTAPGTERRGPRSPNPEVSTPWVGSTEWTDPRGRRLFPLAFPKLASHPELPSAILGSYMVWRYLFEEGVGAHQRCLDVGSGAGLQTAQLALNGASHVHAIDVDERATATTLDTAFRNGVADRVTAEVADLYPWLPEERYQVIVANLPQTPADPLATTSSHRRTDYWGRGLVDQLLSKLPQALAPEGRALVTMISLLSRERTVALLAQGGLIAEVVTWQLHPTRGDFRENREHMSHVEQFSDAYTLRAGNDDALVAYLLEIRHLESRRLDAELPWATA